MAVTNIDEQQKAITKNDFYVEGDRLVVYSGVVLPAICVKTNQPVQSENVQKEVLTWCTPWIGLLFLISGPLLILVYFVFRKQCEITYGLHPEIRQRQLKRRRKKVVVAVALFLLLPFFAASDNNMIIAIAFLAFLASVVAIFLGGANLRITKSSNGRFWVKGCSLEFLKTVANAT